MWTPEGKSGLWVWYTGNSDFIRECAARGMNYVLVKAGDGPTSWAQFSPGLVDQCHQAGLGCMAWTYAYLGDPAAEAEVALEAIRRGADGLVLDVEYEAVNRLQQGAQMVDLIRANTDSWVGYAPDFRIAFGNRWPRGGFSPDVEPFPWESFNKLDGVMPQLYWPDFAQNPIITMDMMTLWREGCEDRGWPTPPIYPIMPSTATAHDIVAAGEYAKTLGAKGANTWRWGNGTTSAQFAITQVEWPEPPQEEEDEMLKPYLEEMGAPEGSVVRALDVELSKEQPDRQEIENIRNRLVELHDQALGE
jgi:hypothetical protein